MKYAASNILQLSERPKRLGPINGLLESISHIVSELCSEGMNLPFQLGVVEQNQHLADEDNCREQVEGRRVGPDEVGGRQEHDEVAEHVHDATVQHEVLDIILS